MKPKKVNSVLNHEYELFRVLHFNIRLSAIMMRSFGF